VELALRSSLKNVICVDRSSALALINASKKEHVGLLKCDIMEEITTKYKKKELEDKNSKIDMSLAFIPLKSFTSGKYSPIETSFRTQNCIPLHDILYINSTLLKNNNCQTKELTTLLILTASYLLFLTHFWYIAPSVDVVVNIKKSLKSSMVFPPSSPNSFYGKVENINFSFVTINGELFDSDGEVSFDPQLSHKTGMMENPEKLFGIKRYQYKNQYEIPILPNNEFEAKSTEKITLKTSNFSGIIIQQKQKELKLKEMEMLESELKKIEMPLYETQALQIYFEKCANLKEEKSKLEKEITNLSQMLQKKRKEQDMLKKEMENKILKKNQAEEDAKKIEKKINEINVTEMRITGELEVLTVVVKNENTIINMVGITSEDRPKINSDVQKLASVLEKELSELQEEKRRVIIAISSVQASSIHSHLSTVSDEEKVQREMLQRKKLEIQELKLEVKRLKTHIKRNKTFRFLFLK
jgi:hypothetical protein